jgi:aspartyl protease family protein
MGSGLSVRHAVHESIMWSAAAAAGILIFHYFEDIYLAVEQSGSPAASVASATAGPDGDQTRERQTHERRRMVLNRSPRPEANYGFRRTVMEPEARALLSPPRNVTLSANSYGHFSVTADISGHPVELMTDTGATYVALNYETAALLGYTARELRYTGRSSTANGVARVAPVRLDYVRIGGIVVRDVVAVVAEPGRLSQNLLGMSFINRLSRFELRGDRLVLTQ